MYMFIIFSSPYNCCFFHESQGQECLFHPMLKSLISLTGKSWQPAVGQQVAKSLQKNGNSTEVTHGEKRSWDVSRKENPDCSFWRWVWQTTHTLRSSPADELQGLPSGNSTGWVNLTGVLNMPTFGYNFQKQTPFLSYYFFPEIQTHLSSCRSHECLTRNTSKVNALSLPPP